MTPQEFTEKMREISTQHDVESRHGASDALLCEVLRELGYGEGVEIYENIEAWYA